MLMRLLSCLTVVVKYHIVGISLSFPWLWHWLHQALLCNVEKLAVDGGVWIHAEKLGIVFNLLILWMILNRLALIIASNLDCLFGLIDAAFVDAGLPSLIVIIVVHFLGDLTVVKGHAMAFDLLKIVVLVLILNLLGVIFIAVFIVLHLHDFSGQIVLVNVINVTRMLARGSLVEIDQFVKIVLLVTTLATTLVHLLIQILN